MKINFVYNKKRVERIICYKFVHLKCIIFGWK